MWITDFNPENYKRPIKLSYDLIDSKNKKRFYQKEINLNFIIAKKFQEKGLKLFLISKDQIIGKYIANDIKNKSGEVIINRQGFDITEEQLEKIINQGEKN